MAKRKKDTVNIGLVQTRVSNDIGRNIKRTNAKIKEAVKKGAQIICLQELYRTKYFPNDERKDVTHLAETIPGDTTLILSRLAKELNVVIIAPIFEVDTITGKYYSSAAVIDADGTLLGTYRKTHIPHDPFFYEKNYFKESDPNYRVFKTRYLNFGVLICYEQWFPEPARVNALQGADVIFYPTAIGYLEGDPQSEKDWMDAWKTVQRAHAIANGVHIAVVNRVGKEGKIKFWGSSFVSDAFGKVLKTASKEDEEVLVVELDIDQNKRIQEGWGFIKNRRPDTYGLISLPVLNDTPQGSGYIMPAEWERHDATWLAWPYDIESFPRIENVEKTYLEMIRTLHESESISLFVRDLNMKSKVTALLGEKSIDLKRINFFVWNYADVWFRDYGTIFVVNKSKGQIGIVHWVFNAWGKKYEGHMRDTQIPHIINQKMHVTYWRPEIVLEGGSVDVNGKGTLLTTEQCLLTSGRNPHLSKGDIERYLMNYFGVTHIIWLKAGIAGDDTDGHIDNLARFVNPGTVLCAYEENEKDENYFQLRENYHVLLKSRDQDGNRLKIVKLPMPPPINGFVEGENKRLPASYLNFYIANKVVLVPTFQCEGDQLALRIIQNEFPDRKVVGIDCIDLLYGLGTFHCITQQQPAVI